MHRRDLSFKHERKKLQRLRRQSLISRRQGFICLLDLLHSLKSLLLDAGRTWRSSVQYRRAGIQQLEKNYSV